jgi:hypothetical protein
MNQALLHGSDIPAAEQVLYQSEIDNPALTSRFMARSIFPNIRNLKKPPGDTYAMVHYDKDVLLTLVEKGNWGGLFLFLTVFQMIIIDLDIEPWMTREECLSGLQYTIETYYPNERFYINKTTRGFHVYLVSKAVDYNRKYAILMRQKFNGDAAHGSNALYTGSSIRLTRKSAEKATPLPISEYAHSFGSGQPDPSMNALYTRIQGFIKQYQDIDPANNLPALHSVWQGIPDDFGRVQIEVTAPLRLTPTGVYPVAELDETSETSSRVWSAFVRTRVLHTDRISHLLIELRRQMAYNNLYHILEASPDYAIGLHVQENLYFMVYRDLLFVDYDVPQRIQIVYQYCRYHPEATFRVVRSNHGYHCFLTSYPVPHQAALPLLRRLCSDPFHLLAVPYRGYSVRISKKVQTEKPYREIGRVGKAEEDPRLLALYRAHLTAYTTYSTKSLHMSSRKNALSVYKSDGFNRIW